jgi:hypothetical protein
MTEPIPNPFTDEDLNDGFELFSRKILIMKMSVDSLNKQIEYSTLSKRFQDYSIETANKKIVLTNQIISVLEKQLDRITDARQQEYLQLVGEINKLDRPNTELCNKLEKVRMDMMGLIHRIDQLEQTMPSEQLLTNYKFK